MQYLIHINQYKHWMKVEVVDYHAVATWHWNIYDGHDNPELVDDLCGICRVAFEGTCPNCKYPGENCPIVLGNDCTHNFHLHCIIKWLEQESSRGLCPMCRQAFTYKKEMLGDMPELSKLIEGHVLMRDRGVVEEEFEQFDGENQ